MLANIKGSLSVFGFIIVLLTSHRYNDIKQLKDIFDFDKNALLLLTSTKNQVNIVSSKFY